MAFWSKRTGPSVAVAPAAGDEELERLLAAPRLSPADVEQVLAHRRDHVEARAHAVHVIGADDRLDAWVDQAESPTGVLLRAVRTHNRAWAARGRAITGMTQEAQFEEFTALMVAAEEQLVQIVRGSAEEEVAWWYLVSSARALDLGVDTALDRLTRLREFAPTHRRGHSHALRYLAPKWGGSEEVLRRFAWDCSDGVPAGSVLHGMVPESLVETWVSRVAGGPDAPPADDVWAEQATLDQLAISFESFARSEEPAAPWRVRDLNTFVFAFARTGLVEPGRRALEQLGGRVSDYPWRYLPEDDVATSFEQAAHALR